MRSQQGSQLRGHCGPTGERTREGKLERREVERRKKDFFFFYFKREDGQDLIGDICGK